MYQFTKKLPSGLSVEVELGIVGGGSKEHVANAHIHVPGFGHVRGITIYRKERKDGAKELVLRMPGYLKWEGDKYKTSYFVLEQGVVDAICEAVEKTMPSNFVKLYTGPDRWSIWGTPTTIASKASQESDDSSMVDESDMTP